MVNIAKRNLFAEKGRLLISIGGVAFAVLLIGILVGLYQGWNDGITAYIRSTGADLWVRQKGSTDLFHSVSYLPIATERQLRSVSGVSRVTPFQGRTVKLGINGKEVMVYAVGYDSASGIGGPVMMVSGKADPQPGQIVIDRSLAVSNGIKIGQQLQLLGQGVTVVGIADGGNMMMYSVAFISPEDAEDLLEMKGLANYFLVKLVNPSQKEQAIQSISQTVPSVEAVTAESFVENNRKFVDESFLPIVSILVIIGFIVGVAVIGLTIYTATMEKAREYGVLKALGATNRRLYRIVFQQALISGVLGYLLGAALTLVIAALAQRASPMFVTSLRSTTMLGIFGLALLMSIVASYFPVNRLVHIDPAMVFRS